MKEMLGILTFASSNVLLQLNLKCIVEENFKQNEKHSRNEMMETESNKILFRRLF
jgi:hypothetical protein